MAALERGRQKLPAAKVGRHPVRRRWNGFQLDVAFGLPRQGSSCPRIAERHSPPDRSIDMPAFNKSLAAGAACALMAAIGAAWAQVPIDDPQDNPAAAAGVAPGSIHILHFKDQGNSPETDPSAHLLLIKHEPHVAVMEESQTVAQATTTDTTPAPAPAPAPSYDTSTSNTTTTTTDLTSAPTDNSAAMPAPKADRN
jgi:hypothetical protein